MAHDDDDADDDRKEQKNAKLSGLVPSSTNANIYNEDRVACN